MTRKYIVNTLCIKALPRLKKYNCLNSRIFGPHDYSEHDPLPETTYRKQILLPEGPCSLDILEISWEFGLRPAWMEHYLTSADAVLLVYDVGSEESFNYISTDCETSAHKLRAKCEAHEATAEHTRPIAAAIATTRVDAQRGTAAISRERRADLATKTGFPHFDCSARTGEGMTEVFEILARRVMETKRLLENTTKPLRAPQKRRLERNLKGKGLLQFLARLSK